MFLVISSNFLIFLFLDYWLASPLIFEFLTKMLGGSILEIAWCFEALESSNRLERWFVCSGDGEVGVSFWKIT